MDWLSFSGGFLLGFLAGAGAIVFYMRWKMMNQLNAMQQDMQGMFDVTEDLMDDMDGLEEADFEEKEGE